MQYDNVDLLIEVLLDRDEEFGARDDAAIELAKSEAISYVKNTKPELLTESKK